MTTITSDLLDLTRGTILHQVNCRGVVGGLAGTLYRKYPRAFDPYFATVHSIGTANLGSCIMAKATPELWILHVFGQMDPGPNTDLKAVRLALAHHNAIALLRPLYAPYLMGCGLGGGDWNAYSAILSERFHDLTIVRRSGD